MLDLFGMRHTLIQFRVLLLTLILLLESISIISIELSPLINPTPLSSLATPSLLFDLDRYSRNCAVGGSLLGLDGGGLLGLDGVRARYIERGWEKSDCEGVFYVHAEVVENFEKPKLPLLNFRLRRRGNDMGDDNDDGIFLALGLNNHYVGGYYWARSGMGAGSSMDAPGVTFNAEKGQLRWGSQNSNDGKRSEWVEFLKPLDQVQLGIVDSKLLPRLSREMNGEGQITLINVVSAAGVPKGAEPKVVATLTV